jgi:AcrR family transcriptional regulator
MTRWEPNARERLERAAFELFAEQGFAQTTVPQITERAGLTTRSFFRHYADKREVLFGTDGEIPERIAMLMASRPPGLSLIELIVWGVQTMTREVIADQREDLKARRAIIQADSGLQERELRKQLEVSNAIRETLRDQGLDGVTASLAGKLATAISSTAQERWLDGPGDRTLAECVTEAGQSLTKLLASDVPWADAH